MTAYTKLPMRPGPDIERSASLAAYAEEEIAAVVTLVAAPDGVGPFEPGTALLGWTAYDPRLADAAVFEHLMVTALRHQKDRCFRQAATLQLPGRAETDRAPLALLRKVGFRHTGSAWNLRLSLNLLRPDAEVRADGPAPRDDAKQMGELRYRLLEPDIPGDEKPRFQVTGVSGTSQAVEAGEAFAVSGELAIARAAPGLVTLACRGTSTGSVQTLQPGERPAALSAWARKVKPGRERELHVDLIRDGEVAAALVQIEILGWP